MISIIIPTVGRSSIKTTQASLAGQVYKEFETIIIEDKERSGSNWARNMGYKKAKGEYLLFLDDDVVLDKYFLKKMFNTLEKYQDSSYAYCHYYRCGIFNDIFRAIPFSAEELKKRNYISTMSLVRKKDFVGWDEKIKRYQDWDLWLSMLEKGKTGILIDETLFKANFRGRCITNKDLVSNLKARKIILDKHSLPDDTDYYIEIIEEQKDWIDHLQQDIDKLNGEIRVLVNGEKKSNINFLRKLILNYKKEIDG